MPIRKISTNVDWPGQRGPSNFDRWSELYRALDTLYIGGPAIELELDSEKEIPAAQAAVSGYGRKQNCQKSDWMYQTTKRATKLTVQKIRRNRR